MPATEGWYVAEASWFNHDVFGATCEFESSKAEFRELGIRICVLLPGQPNGLYHREETQEDFLVLAGGCLLLVEGVERRLRAWDFFHCASMTEHIFIGAGDGPCVVPDDGNTSPGSPDLLPRLRAGSSPRRRGGGRDAEPAGGVRILTRGAPRASGGLEPAALGLRASAGSACDA